MSGREQRTLSLQVGLIVLPLLILLLLGIYFLRQDKMLVESEARQRAGELALQIMAQFKSAETNFPSPEFYTNLNNWPEQEAFFQVGTNGELVFPPPLQTNRSSESIFTGLSPTVSNLWRRAEEDEFVAKRRDVAIKTWKLLSETNLPARAKAIVEFNLALLLKNTGQENEAERLFDRLRTISSSERLPSGLPIAHLAALKHLNSRPGFSNLVLETGWKLISEPTEFSFFLLDQIGNDPDLKARLKGLWNQQECARELHGALATSLEKRTTDFNFVEKQLSVTGTNWWLFRKETNYFARSQTGMAQLARENIGLVGLPAHLSGAMFSGGRLLYSSGEIGSNELLGSANAEETGAERERVELFLAKPELLYARQHQRALWLGGLLALSTLVAGAGLVHTSKSYLKQQRLNELKSNFVSSVSHELRAPLASMRLMSEGLQSGRIQDQEKQREYYNYLVQECRRLSVLVENLLDFSRIDQNKKIYEFEPVDLREVVHAAIKTISPVAAERQVKLDFEDAQMREECMINGDGLALQQAVVNLLDNAIKHSPPDESISITLREDTSHWEILVRDRGPGVPPNERQRIFERFYRLGSELRRETPGIGIGLSIVKHIVEAHRGTVCVEAAPEQGAVFVISLPRHENR